MYSKVYKTLIIGSGNIGAFFDTPQSRFVLTHAHAFSQNGFRLVGFVNRGLVKGSLAAKIWKTNIYPSLYEAYENNNEIDVIIVAAPDESHYKILKEISNYKVKLVLCEKPLTANLDQAREITALFKRKRIPLAVNYTRRYLPAFQKLKKQIHQNIYGSFLKGSGYYGNGILHNGSHLVDLVRYLISDIISAHTYEEVAGYSTADPNVSSILKLRNGKHFILESIPSKNYSLFEVDLLFEKGRIRIDGATYLIYLYHVERHPIFRNFFILQQKSKLKTQQEKAMDYLAIEIYRFLSMKKSLICSAEEALKDMEVCKKLLIRH